MLFHILKNVQWKYTSIYLSILQKRKTKKTKKKRQDATDDQFDRLMFDVDILSVKFFFNHSKND